LQLIAQVLNDKKHLSHAAYLSPHYSKLPNVLYHLSRLMAVNPIPLLEPYKPALIEQAQAALKKNKGLMDQIILHTALLRWGVNMPSINIQPSDSLYALVEQDKFSFFIANIASMLPNPLKQWMGGAGIGKFYYDCDAYNYMLLLEYWAWRQKMPMK
jgi:hypothetical protein